MTDRDTDKKYMEMAVRLAAKGMGRVSPNPMVGAVIVKDGDIIGEGWHEYCGGLHAERNALKNCKERGNDPEGATMYVTLEPCCHYGKTPPCTEAVIENGLSRIVFGAWDPNPLVAGKGIQLLKDAGVHAEGPVLEAECLKRNEIFFHYITTGTPYVIMKYAMTADGKIAAHTGDSRWVTSEQARQHTHLTRKQVSAIMVGIGTVLADDPMLNCRLAEDSEEQISFDPIRIICDSKLRIPWDSKIIKTAEYIRTIIVCVETQEQEVKSRSEVLQNAGAEVLEVSADKNGRIDMKELMKKLGEMKIDSVLLEGGSEIHFSALEAGIVSKVQVYMAPKLIGGAAAKTPIGGAGIDKMADCVMLAGPEITILGDDILLEYTIK
ncbi:MAG: bifunctional diaminohydroxyphosphoribosylaminopyrimidine deaminase/5-amino-6-(5-phosphoribosylamino)uracil reductase RibD [Firmicutes bacterium]|nr:bifunctional diaminohydroxyphosphoribosylaminopyrimidine deaminase/5-amino-6-(5-phosphoribosylamino)uracil reductase RibD [Bacillota bacterium]